MDGLRKNLFTSALFSLLAITATAGALEIEYISPEQKNEISAEFERAKNESAEKAIGRRWSCDMFGVRSGLQVQRGVKLYSLQAGLEGAVKNTGSQVVSNYLAVDGRLKGQNERFEDELRMTRDGRLISRLSLRQGSPSVIAYSLCKPL